MKPLFFIANWKSNKTSIEAVNWIESIKEKLKDLPSNKTIILCPSFTLLPDLKHLISSYNLPIKLGAQNVSPFEQGAHTGEVNAAQIKEYADYVLIGHSERRKDFNETIEDTQRKIEICRKFDLTPIYLAQNENDPIDSQLNLIAYEPPSSISPGPADSPENADSVALKIKSLLTANVLYGGNVTPDNVSTFTVMPNIDGVLVGRDSLDPLEFAKIIDLA